MPRRYTDEEKRLVLDRLIANHGDVVRTAAESGINERTLYMWRKDSDFADIAAPNLKKLPHLPQNPASSPSLRSGEGLGEGIGLPPETTAAFQSLHDKLLAIADILSNRIVESIDDAPLNQRMTALSQLIDRIAKLAALLPAEEEEIEYVHEYEYEVEHHVEKRKEADEEAKNHGSSHQNQTED